MQRKLLLAYFKNFVFLHVVIIVVAVAVQMTRTVHTRVRPLAQSLSDAIHVSSCNQSRMLKQVPRVAETRSLSANVTTKNI